MLERVEAWVSENRGMAIGVGVLSAVLLWGLFFGEGSPIRAPGSAIQEPSGVELRRLLDAAEAAPPPVQETPEAEARRLVGEYVNKALDEPSNPDAPAMFLAAGNLQMERLNDPREAAGFYARIIYSYPDWEGTSGVYPQLAKAYSLSGQEVERQRLLLDMIAKFPPEAPERQYAEAELGRRDPVPKTRP